MDIFNLLHKGMAEQSCAVLRSLLVLDSQGLHQEAEQVSVLFNTLESWFASPVTRLGVHPDHQWVSLV